MEDAPSHRSYYDLLAAVVDREGWSPRDLGQMFEHQLTMAIPAVARPIADGASSADHAANSPTDPTESHPAATGSDGWPQGAPTVAPIPSVPTFGSVLRDPIPSLDALRVIKAFAKASSKAEDAPLPEAVATALYFTAEAVAITRRGTTLSSLPPDDLRAGLAWLGNLDFLPADLHMIAMSAKHRLLDLASRPHKK